MDQGNFTSLSWDQEDHSHASTTVVSPRGGSEEGIAPQPNRRSSSMAMHMQAGRNADELDLAGVGTARLECTVTQPMKENDGTKDAYVSYLVTTNVCLSQLYESYVLTSADDIPVL